MKLTNPNAIFMFLIILLHGPRPSSTQEFNVEIPKECQHFCDSKRQPHHKKGPYLLICNDDYDCSDVSCEVHKCPSIICKNGRTIFCPSTKGSYHASSRVLSGPLEIAPIESQDSSINFVFWALSSLIIIGLCCALVSWNTRRKSQRTPEGHMPGGYIHAHQDQYRRRKKGGGCFPCCSGGYEEDYHPRQQQRGRPSIMYLEEDEDESGEHDKPYSFDRVHSQQSMMPEVTDNSNETTINTTVIQDVRSASSISVIKAPPMIQPSQTNIPAISLDIPESASSIESGMLDEMITYRRPST